MSGPVGFDAGRDSLYVYKEKFIYVASKTLPLPANDEPDLRNLLELVRVIMNKTTSISGTKNGEKPTKTKQMTHTWSRGGVMQRYASSIGRQIALYIQDEKADHSESTWKILESNTDNIPLKTKAILALVAFATMYGKLRLVALVTDSNQLAKSITLLKQQPDIQVMKDQSQKWFEALSKIVGLALDLADSLMNLKEPQGLPNIPENELRDQMALLSTTVHRIVHIVLICWSQVVAILINHSRQDKTSYLIIFDQWERNLRDKNLEIGGKLAKKDGPSTVPADEQSQAPELTRTTSASCWQKLCHIITLTYCRIGKGEKV